MAQINFTVPNDKLQRIVAAMKGLDPIPQIPDPAFVPGPDETKDDAPLINEFTDNQWAKERVRRFIISQVARWEQKTAQDAIIFTKDNTIAS